MSFHEMFTQEFWDERCRGKQVWSGDGSPGRSSSRDLEVVR